MFSPTVLVGDDPTHEAFSTEYFGPVLAVHVYDDADYDTVLTQMEAAAPYALTGAVIAQDRAAVAHAQRVLRFAAGNFYVNDKPTGAVVGQQPFGGGRASGTNDKAGAAQNLQRWTSTRSMMPDSFENDLRSITAPMKLEKSVTSPIGSSSTVPIRSSRTFAQTLRGT